MSVSSITEDPNQDEFIFKNQNGNIVLLINASGHLLYTGEIIDSAITDILYEPYGATLTQTDSRLAYEGKELSDTGYDFHFRNYNPELGLFTQPDTLLPNVYDPQQLNRYAFERGNPYKYVDPTGHLAPLALFLIGTAIVGLIGAGISFIDDYQNPDNWESRMVDYGVTASLALTGFIYGGGPIGALVLGSIGLLYSGVRAGLSLLDEKEGESIEKEGDELHEGQYFVSSSKNMPKVSVEANNAHNTQFLSKNSMSLISPRTPSSYVRQKIQKTKNSGENVKWYYNEDRDTYTWRLDDSDPGDGYEEFEV